MNDSGVKIEVHLIQNFALSNLNRDDTGQPKSATFGRFRRARVSSQCIKRVIREWWREHATVTVGERTKKLQKLIDDKLVQDKEFNEKVASEEDRKVGIRVFTEAYYASVDKKKPDKTSVLIFIGSDEIDACVQAIKEIWDDKIQKTSKKEGKSQRNIKGIASIIREVHNFDAKNISKKSSDSGEDNAKQQESLQSENEEISEVEGTKKSKPRLDRLDEIENRIRAAQVSSDIALFGRMLADPPGRNTDGACQVAHSISTHKVDMEMDFYTAVDDLNPAEETGAGMMGVVGFNSACYYRYALVDRDQLARNLARKAERKNGKWVADLTAEDYCEADKVIKEFLEAMVYAVPTGKQNSFAAQNPPSFGLFVRRRGGVPVSLANAFSKPVRPMRDDEDLIGLSVSALTKYWADIQKVYENNGVQVTACFHVAQDDRLNDLKTSDKGTIAGAIDAVLKP